MGYKERKEIQYGKLSEFTNKNRNYGTIQGYSLLLYTRKNCGAVYEECMQMRLYEV